MILVKHIGSCYGENHPTIPRSFNDPDYSFFATSIKEAEDRVSTGDNGRLPLPFPHFVFDLFDAETNQRI